MDNLYFKYNGKLGFDITDSDGLKISDVDDNSTKKIMYTYFSDYSLPPKEWCVSDNDLNVEYHKKMLIDYNHYKSLL